MKVRVLSPEEFAALPERGQPPSLPYARPENLDYVVLEDETGAPVAGMTVLWLTHVEGVWIRPEHRGNAGVMGALLREAGRIARERGEVWAIASAEDGDEVMSDYLKRVGGDPVPVRFWAVGVEEGLWRR